MAGADYYSCDICGRKTFYDSDLNYDRGENENPETHHLWPDGNVGWMVVICKDCATGCDVLIKSKGGTK